MSSSLPIDPNPISSQSPEPLTLSQRMLQIRPNLQDDLVNPLFNMLQTRLGFIVEELAPLFDTFEKQSIWLSAFTHKSLSQEFNYDILAAIGNEIIYADFSEYLRLRFSDPPQNPIGADGQPIPNVRQPSPLLDPQRITLIHNNFMAKITQPEIFRQFGFTALITPVDTTEFTEREQLQIYESVFKAFMGALFMLGQDAFPRRPRGAINSQKIFANLFDAVRIDITAVKQNYVTQLKELYEQQPGWTTLNEDNFRVSVSYASPASAGEATAFPSGNAPVAPLSPASGAVTAVPIFTFTIRSQNGTVIGEGTGSSRKEAHQEASKQALQYWADKGFTRNPLKGKRGTGSGPAQGGSSTLEQQALPATLLEQLQQVRPQLIDDLIRPLQGIMAKLGFTPEEITAMFDTYDKYEVWLSTFTHKKISHEFNYETLETIGDKAIFASFTEYLRRRFSPQPITPDIQTNWQGQPVFNVRLLNPALDPQKITLIHNMYMSEITQPQLLKELGLTELITPITFDDDTTGEQRNKMEEDVFEAFMGAIFVLGQDSYPQHPKGYEYHQKVFEPLFNNKEINLDVVQQNYVTQLKEMYEHYPGWTALNNDNFTLEVTKKDPRGHYKFTIRGQDGTVIGTGYGDNKKQAQQEASREALEYWAGKGFTPEDALQKKRDQDLKLAEDRQTQSQAMQAKIAQLNGTGDNSYPIVDFVVRATEYPVIMKEGQEQHKASLYLVYEDHGRRVIHNSPMASGLGPTSAAAKAEAVRRFLA